MSRSEPYTPPVITVNKWKRLKLWWEWRKFSRKDWPFKYVGPTTSFITYGIPLQKLTKVQQRAQGRKGKDIKSNRWLTPDGFVRVIGDNYVAQR